MFWETTVLQNWKTRIEMSTVSFECSCKGMSHADIGDGHKSIF